MRPSLIIIGAQKGGTSSLYQMLRQHPKVLAPEVKELHFFENDERYAKGLDHYWQQFPRKPIREPDMITFEATPNYLFHAHKTAARIHQALPGVLCLAMLRDPVKRAYSAWNMYRDFKGKPDYDHLAEDRSFAQAVEDEFTGKEQPAHKLYLARGYYSEQLAHFMQHFPREQILVHGFKELKERPHELFGKVCEKLGLEDLPRDHRVFTMKANTRTYPLPMDADLAERLYDHFAPEMERLNKLLGRDLQLIEHRVGA